MKGICFIEPLYHNVVSGCKVQTRRISKHQHFSYSELSNINQGVYINPAVPKYLVGETVYLKESYSIDGVGHVHYKYGCNQIEMDRCNRLWSNKLFMPQSAARHFIKITGVRAERLQDISLLDCLKEGIKEQRIIRLDRVWYENGLTINGQSGWPTPKKAYTALINKINGKGTWERNPWVWVYDFQLIK